MENEYFETLLKMAAIIEHRRVNLAPLGIVPADPNEKYGYNVPKSNAILNMPLYGY